MPDSAYCGERLLAQLDGATLVRYDTAGYLLAWFGGHGVHVYDAAGTEVDYWTCGSFADDQASLDEVEASMAARIRNVDAIIEQAEEEGYELGKTAGSWLLDGNSTEQAARRLLQGIEEGDPAVLDALPSSPLSGEWADAPLPRDVLEGLGMDEDDDAADGVLRAFQDGYCRGVEDEACRSARSLLGVEVVS
jgi:hypothetical protein